MTTKDFFILLGIFIVVAFIVLNIFFPIEEKKSKKQKRKEIESQISKEDKKWQETAISLRERVSIFKQKIIFLNQEKKKVEKFLQEEKEKNARLEEKLKREKKWFSEQESSLGKRAQDVRKSKIEVVRLQTELEKEYSLRLAAERNQKILQEDFDKTKKEKKDLILKITHLEFTIKTQKEELFDVRRAHDALLRKQEEAGQWVAKSEVEKLMQSLKEKEKEIEELKQCLRGQG